MSGHIPAIDISLLRAGDAHGTAEAATTVDARYGVVHAGWVVSAVGDSKLSSV